MTRANDNPSSVPDSSQLYMNDSWGDLKHCPLIDPDQTPGLPLCDISAALRYCAGITGNLLICSEGAADFTIEHHHVVNCLRLLLQQFENISEGLKRKAMVSAFPSPITLCEHDRLFIVEVEQGYQTLEKYYKDMTRPTGFPLAAVQNNVDRCIAITHCLISCGSSGGCELGCFAGNNQWIDSSLFLMQGQIDLLMRTLNTAQENSIPINCGN